ncbi:hypothetical protein GSI_07100 [Ganoderma sinense ZZ0214-1]|uniref:Small EDRK-rich factor-like N-terminal domain-containing protein n=1 Tax=Ganoderma sinense ZZ0214-1 TaxID=1077348 RepID=A0A2G8SAZ9_9APHY|nr:hypothetical protein GSI_07100 [Ganoderma sinense ZZ0214-1]
MTRGNQRETDRAKAQKKAAAGKNKPKESATTLQQRREKDAAALREKQKKRIYTHRSPIDIRTTPQAAPTGCAALCEAGTVTFFGV